MASGGAQYKDYEGKNVEQNKPRSNRKPPRSYSSFNGDLSLHAELQRNEHEDYDSLPNNLSWTGKESLQGRKAPLFGDQFSSDGSPTSFTHKKHTPATLPRTKFSSSGSAQHRSMDKLKQHLTFSNEDENEGQHNNIPVNNERSFQTQRSPTKIRSFRRQEKDGAAINSLQPNVSNVKPVDYSKAMSRLKQVRGYLKQATSLYITLSSKSTSPDEATDEELEQMDKLAKLIKDLKAQEMAYVDFVQRTNTTQRESSLENTPSTSVVSLDVENLDNVDVASEDDLEGLRQQHALLRQMVEQQKQLKELQLRQNALLDLQRHAEDQLKEAEAEGRRISNMMNGHGLHNGIVNVDGREEGTEISEDSHSLQDNVAGGSGNVGELVSNDSRHSNDQVQRNRKAFNKQKCENFKNRRLPNEQPSWVADSAGSITPDNEAQALAAADAAQERLELESKMMDLQAKKEEMNVLVAHLQQLRELQLAKEMAPPQERSVNESNENQDDDVPLATRSAKDTGENVDDEKIIEALQLHKKLRKLQDVRDKLERLKNLFDGQQINPSRERARITEITEGHESSDNKGDESQMSSVDPDTASDDVPLANIDWILNSGIDDPELIEKLRQVKAAKERVAHLKQRSEQNNVDDLSYQANALSVQAHGAVATDNDSAAQTDNETTGSVSSSLLWQEDPEFQEKLRKLNAARKKLRKLQALVKKTEELPLDANGRPCLPVEIPDMSFTSDEEGESNANSTGAVGNDEESIDSEQDATSETLVQDNLTYRQQEDDESNNVLGYMNTIDEQRATLNRLFAEERKLRETQEHLKKLQQQNDAMTQTRPPERSKQLDSFIHNPTEASSSGLVATADSATQTLFSSDVHSGNHQPDDSLSNTLLWRELRRQRELQEQKLKKRKERLLLERKAGRRLHENASEDEGFGRSTLSADITTATWGGSTQMSSTQNDSAVSEGSSNDSDEELLVEDDALDDIVQAEEEEEEEGHSEMELYPTASNGGRKKFPNSQRKQNASQKRLLFEGLRKQDLERHERFKGWQNSLFPSGNKKSFKKTQRESNPRAYDDEEYSKTRERAMWERQFNVMQAQLENTTTLCNTLLRDQQTLISVLLNRREQPSTLGETSFSQYQRRQQEALQGIQNYFDQQRFLVQQQQMLQNLTECYSQMQQQHEDMLHLQQSFSQLFSYPSSEEKNCQPSPVSNTVTSTLENSRTSNSFSFQPRTSYRQKPNVSSAARETPSPFTSFQTRPSVERHVHDHRSASSQNPLYPSVSFPWLPDLRNRQFQFQGSTNPDTGVPSPETSNSQAIKSSEVKPVSARVVSSISVTSANSSPIFSRVTYTDSKANDSNNVVVGKQFPTPLRASAAAQLAGQDQSKWRGAKRRRQEDKIETDSVSSHQSSLPGDSEKPGTESDAQSDYSLFEALRDSIYAEVATLISQNESRPHFLIELFRELQLLGSDYLRQRALYSLRDLVTRFLKDDPSGRTMDSSKAAYSWPVSASEQTPSESVAYSENDQDEDKMTVQKLSSQGIYDYVEAVDTGSSMSTPNSGNYEPFASEFLGETVIHLDKALKSVREKERGDSECSGVVVDEVAPTVVPAADSSSAGDIASESSLPDIQYPKIDTQALDRQIKKIMAEVIPYLNDHMEDTCSLHLLNHIRKTVMGMIQNKNEEKEFGRFFNKQLESILQDSLAKFIGKRMKDCGEDLLVEISEILFNELAFYKLMQELQGGTRTKIFNQKEKNTSHKKQSTNENLAMNSVNTEEEMKNDLQKEVEDSSCSSSEWQVVEVQEEKPRDVISRELLQRDEETLGKDRDDAMAEEFDERRNQSEVENIESSECVNVVELSMSESKPLASNGSDDNESEVEIVVEVQQENAEGAVWSEVVGGMNGGQDDHQSDLASQMATNDPTKTEEDQGARTSNPSKQEEDEDFPTKFTGLTEADLQVKIAEEQSRHDGIHAIVASMNDGEELAGDPNTVPEPEGSVIVNGDVMHEAEN